MSHHRALFPQTIMKAVATSVPADLHDLLHSIHLPGALDTTSRVAAFLDRLFYRSPPEVTRRKTEEELRQIIHGCLKVLRQQGASPDQIGIVWKSTVSGVGVFLALSDHPFIISSLAERFYEANVSLNCFQHPILSINGTNIALSYLEIPEHPINELETLLGSLRDTLRSLITIVDDYESMLTLTRTMTLPSTGTMLTDWGSVSSSEVHAFINWLVEGSFFFIGAGSLNAGSGVNNGRGIWNTTGSFREKLGLALASDLDRAIEARIAFSITKLPLRSPIHRMVPLLQVLVQQSNESSNWLALTGYLTSKAWAHEALDIPILRKKLHQVLATEHTPPNSHDYKYVIEVIDNMPTDEALRMPIRDLQTIAHLALGTFSREDSRSVTCIDTQRRWALTTIIVPPERYSAEMREEVQSIIESSFSARPGSSELHLDSSKKRQLRLYISTPLLPSSSTTPDLEELGRALQRATLSWEETLSENIDARDPKLHDMPLIFPDNYQASISISEAINDYTSAVQLSSTQPLAISLFSQSNNNKTPQLSILALGSSVSLSTAVPVLENIGLEVLDANSYRLNRNQDAINVLKCVVRPYDNTLIDCNSFNASVTPGLVQILQGSAENDPLNLLLRTGGLSVAQIALLRCYCALLWQTHKVATKRTMWKALAYSPQASRTFIEYFETAFNPTLALSAVERRERCAQIKHDFQKALRQVPDITHDRILKALLVLMRFTVRTNYYRSPETLALKIHSERVEFMPHPRPLYEIFVYSSRIEGTHLRSSKVARGGIRWSERLDDYRSEVLGLVKTQKAKNVIIVPSGAKGGFIVKSTPAAGESMSALVESSYCEYIAALLSITDNVVDGTSVHPPLCVIQDDFDPYFVVAADKGTATFSDTANRIAQDQYSFWLGDAFASGGSQGYDHKKYGITARGGWECVQRHARDLGIDIHQPFTTIGIGDMSGDVFGNALILTSSMLLIGAFNHKHIFIDPNPNQEEAFKERCRLFSLPRSQWTDFNSSIISQGGGIFDRFEKEIQLSAEIRRALGIAEDIPPAVDGETLISLLLKAPITLLWNGGIGTYFKARAESHSDINDGANDAVRVNADELRCKIVGEGGNVGFTQKARIQCAQSGIRINTDAIDNSGGVDLSDHEVNLKLLLSPLVSKGAMSSTARNNLLKDIAPDVVESVLQHNRDQSLLLTIADVCSPQTLEHYRALIREMHSRGFLDRTRDYLPDEQELDLRASSQRGMYRPELAVCSAAVKMWLKESLRASELLDDANLVAYLMGYFPKRIQTEHRESILEHSLRRDIIANEIVGEMTLAIGISFLPATIASTGTSIPHAMRSLLAADTILQTRELRSRLRVLDTFQGCTGFINAWLDLSTALRRACSWLMHSHPSSSSIQELLQLYGDSFSALIPHARTMFSAQELQRFEGRVSHYRASGVPEGDAVILSLLRRVHVVLEILWCAREYRQNVKDVAATLSSVLHSLELQPLFSFERTFQAVDRWEQELVECSFQEIRRELSRITGKLLSRSFATDSALHASLTKHKQHHAICAIMSEVSEGVRTRRPLTISVLPLIVRHLRELALFTV